MLQQGFLGWNIVGTYNGSILALWEAVEDVGWEKVVFLDLEILRSKARSIGNHMLAAHAEHAQELSKNFPNCANPNMWRGLNAWNSFGSKYPFATLPMLLAARISKGTDLGEMRAWLSLMLQADSTFTNAAMYQANALDWLKVMGGSDHASPIERFCTLLARLPAQSAMQMVEDVQGWAHEAGFGAVQRACKFDSTTPSERAKAAALATRIAKETGMPVPAFLSKEPKCIEKFEESDLSAKNKGSLVASAETSKKNRVISMAITGKTEEGFSYTLANPKSSVVLFR